MTQHHEPYIDLIDVGTPEWRQQDYGGVLLDQLNTWLEGQGLSEDGLYKGVHIETKDRHFVIRMSPDGFDDVN